MKALFLLAELNIGDTAVNPIAKVANLGTLINLFTPLAILGAVLLFGGMLILSAYKILSAGGNAEEVEAGKKMITSAVLGLVIVFLAYLLVKIIGFVLDINIPI